MVSQRGQSRSEHLGCRMLADAGISHGRPWTEEAAEKIDAGLRAALASRGRTFGRELQPR